MTIRDRLAVLCAVVVLLTIGFAGTGWAEGRLALTTGHAAAPPHAVGDRRMPTIALTGAAAELAGAADSSLGERAIGTILALADDIGSRPAGSENERRAATYLAGEYRAANYEVQLMPFSVSSGRGESQNVEARARNEDPNAPLVIIGAHYDSVPAGPGANDNASGTSTILEVARELAASPVPGVAVRYVSFGAEEIGLLGSRAYVNAMSAPDRQRVVLMMSVDMMAVGDQPAFGGSSEWVARAMARADAQGYRPLNQSDRLRRMSDHAPFIEAGMPALMFHWVDDPFYHTALDIPANVQPFAIDLMGSIVVDLVRFAAP
jgi:Zn-dependent M28 family amino/carboxypeptidase